MASGEEIWSRCAGCQSLVTWERRGKKRGGRGGDRAIFRFFPAFRNAGGCAREGGGGVDWSRRAASSMAIPFLPEELRGPARPEFRRWVFRGKGGVATTEDGRLYITGYIKHLGANSSRMFGAQALQIFGPLGLSGRF
ncbi:hypothetical protein KM043_006584 [Ampulex compressa]|nr:hypothetical protein KM043_006584 [Ampulex compressa]